MKKGKLDLRLTATDEMDHCNTCSQRSKNTAKPSQKIHLSRSTTTTTNLSTLGKHRGYGLGANATLNLGDTNTLVVTTVNVIALPTGRQIGMDQSVVIREAVEAAEAEPADDETIEPEPRRSLGVGPGEDGDDEDGDDEDEEAEPTEPQALTQLRKQLRAKK